MSNIPKDIKLQLDTRGIKHTCIGFDVDMMREIFGDNFNEDARSLTYNGNPYHIAIDDGMVTDAWLDNSAFLSKINSKKGEKADDRLQG